MRSRIPLTFVTPPRLGVFLYPLSTHLGKSSYTGLAAGCLDRPSPPHLCLPPSPLAWGSLFTLGWLWEVLTGPHLPPLVSASIVLNCTACWSLGVGLHFVDSSHPPLLHYTPLGFTVTWGRLWEVLAGSLPPPH